MRSEIVQFTGDASGTLHSPAVWSQNLFNCSLQGTFAGGTSPTGTLKLEFSNDPGNPLLKTVPTNWNDIPDATVSVTTIASYAIPKTDVCYQWIRITYTPSGGTGTL